MSGFVVGAVLFAALLHASWNALVKSRADIVLTTLLVAVGGGLFSALALPFLAAPAAASWPFMAASALTQLLYYALLVSTYRSGDISHGYPLMRGSAPLLVALASAPLTGERLGGGQWLAIACICGGILTLYFAGHKDAAAARRTTVRALMTACAIATYTMIDGIGVRKSDAPAAYTMWIFLLTAIGCIAWCAFARPGELARYARANPPVLLLGGGATLGSYGIALWAMTQAPVAAIAALRETSILFATAIAALVLRERIGARRLLAIGMVACGAVLMRLA
jgi:drug/metabolite transporter (DMT)-like permease